MRWIIIAACAVLLGCQPEDAPQPDLPALGQQDQTCQSQGGQPVVGGFGQFVCQMPTPDAGADCTSSADCTGHCLADGQVCTPSMPYFGCYDTYENGQIATLCVD